MHTHYYVHRSHGTKPMNKLQKEISQFICSLNGKLIHTEDLSNFKKLVLDKIENIQSSNPRCKKMSISFDDSHDKTKIYLSGFYIENLYLYPATLVHVSTLEYKSLSNTDITRLANLEDTIDLVERLTQDIIFVARNKESYENSVKVIGLKADSFITEMRENVTSGRTFTENEISQLQSKIHAITGDGEVMGLFNEMLGISAG